MGTTWSVDYFGAPAESVRPAIDGALENLNAQMSHWRDDSILSQFNNAPAGSWLELPCEFFTVLRFALKIARQTNGAFDPALGHAVNAWGFGPKYTPLQATEPLWHRIRLDQATRRALQPGGAALDLSAIAKGFAVDHLARLLDARCVNHYLVEIGGELRARGIKHDNQPWWVAIEPPAETFVDEFLIALHDTAIATSGDYRRSCERNGVRYSHTIDPRTASPTRHPIASVSVIAATAMAADAYSTALTVLGPDEGLRFADKHNLPALFLLRDNRAIQSRAFAQMLA